MVSEEGNAETTMPRVSRVLNDFHLAYAVQKAGLDVIFIPLLSVAESVPLQILPKGIG